MVYVAHVFSKSGVKELDEAVVRVLCFANRFSVSPVSVTAKYDNGALKSSFSI
jgi:hypothetical protein